MTETSDLPLPPDPLPETATEGMAAGLAVDGPRVGLVADTPADDDGLAGTRAVLDEAEVLHETRVASSLLEPDVVLAFARSARAQGLRVLVAAAGPGSALPGLLAAHTDLPVVAVPLRRADGRPGHVGDEPEGVPVAAVGPGAARNAGHLAVRILGA